MKFIPEADLQTIDALWRAASGNRFGYTVQKELWLQSRKNWPKFLQQINWVQGVNNFYRCGSHSHTPHTTVPNYHILASSMNTFHVS